MRILAIFFSIFLVLGGSAKAADRPTMNVGVQGVWESLDPAIALANVGFPISYNIFDTLIGRDFHADGKPTSYALVPGLAESWTWKDDQTLEFSLREGVTFHNGDPFTSEDVKFTFDRILDTDSQYAGARFMFETVESVVVIDDMTVQIKTSKPDPLLEHVIAYYPSMIVPKGYFESVGFDGFSQAPVGTGPYKLEELRADESVTLAAYDDYWNGEPPASKVVFKVIPEVSARITALVNGEVDIINSISPDQIDAISARSCCEVRSVLVNNHLLNYNVANEVMSDKKLRQALNLAIDRQLLVDALWRGNGAVMLNHQYPDWQGGFYNADRDPVPFDPEQAKKLLAESRYAGQEIVFTTSPNYYTNGLAAAEAIVEMWRKIGVNAKVVVNEDWYTLSIEDPTIGVRNLSDWQMPADPAATLGWSWGTEAMWGNAEFERLHSEALSTRDVNARSDIYQQMLDLYVDDAPGIALYRVSEFYGVRKDLEWTPYTDYTTDFRRDNLRF